MNEDELNQFLGKFVTGLGETAVAGNVVIGHRLGLYRALACEPATPERLAIPRLSERGVGSAEPGQGRQNTTDLPSREHRPCR
jgi:hypothetical protein